MFYLDVAFFLARHAPFWAIPSLLIFGHFGYIYWLKGLRDSAIIFFGLSFIAGVFLIFFVWAGGPDMAGKLLFEIYQKNFE